MTTEQKVNRALDVAIFENGYVELLTQSPIEVAEDLADYCPDLEGVSPVRLSPIVKKYQERKAV